MSDYRTKAIGLIGNECEVCGGTKTIEVHHIDGDRSNNSIFNLKVLCKDCHNNVHSKRKNIDDELIQLRNELSHVTHLLEVEDELWEQYRRTVNHNSTLGEPIIEFIENRVNNQGN